MVDDGIGGGIQERLLEDVCRVAAGLLEAMAHPALLLHHDLRIAAANAAMCEHLRVERDDLIDTCLTEGAVPPLTDRQFLERLQAIAPGSDGFHGFEIEVELPDGHRQTWFVSARQVWLDSIDTQLILLSIKDITQTAQAITELTGEQDKARSLTADLALAEERQKRRVAIDLHDGPVQTLVLLNRRLRTLRDRVEAENTDRVEACLQLVDLAQDQIRKLTYDLSPPVLYDLGLLPALDWLVGWFRKEHELDASLISAVADALALSRSVQVVCFRCVRELLMNAGKHAAGSEVIVTVGHTNGSAQIVVRDTGPGFDISRLGVRADSSLGYGLVSLQEQVRGIGGEVEIHSVIGEGTRVTLTIPLQEG